ncbi:CapA family protein [Nocardiopsis sp. N85]|uniref:CapA family protein n=1 Tax=Nocardiopsis sp. N85 TaxID=3029400 RepID=UPI00237F2EC5|nr:CapA family protein [Nocardiopsis sp. N85]MDE3723340.1 CapA family protein [Nocardiopsis sp. N85]
MTASRPAHRAVVRLCTPSLLLVAALAGCSVPEVEHTTTAGPPSPSPHVPRTLSVIGGGDVLVHSSVWEEARRNGEGEFDFAPLFAGIAPTLNEADLALCHLEVPLAPEEGPFTGYPVFAAPPQVARGLAESGYDGCSTASNHTLDGGEAGVVRTLDAMEEAGLGAAGSARTEEEAALPTIYEVASADGGDPVPVAHLSYTYGFNGFLPPEGKEWMADLIDEEAILAEAALARERGARIVVLSMHWGTEHMHQADADQRELSRLVGSPDIDLILGHHAHVVQSVERVDGEWVVYGLGNQVSGQSSPPIDSRREGVLAKAEFTEVEPGVWESTALEMVPTWVALDPLRVVDLADALASPGLSKVDREVYGAAVERIASHVDGLGVSADPDFSMAG